MSSVESRALRAFKRWAKNVTRAEHEQTHTESLESIARQLGFSNYRMAERILSFHPLQSDHQGSLWYSHRCAGSLNAWFTTHAEARNALIEGRYSFPYRGQFVVVGPSYLESLGLTELTALPWNETEADFVLGYGSAHWDRWAATRIHCMRLEDARFRSPS